MEEQKKRDKGAIQHIFEKVLPVLAVSLHGKISQITPMFHDFHLERVIDTWTKAPDAGNEAAISIENGNVYQMGIRLRLEGFQRAGIPPFDISKDLLFTLERTGYEVGPTKKEVWGEKYYYEPWSKAEVEALAQKWSNDVIDEITQRLQELG